MADDETMADYWRDMKPAMQEASQKRRADNRQNSAEMLRAFGVKFDSRNNGAHLVVKHNETVIDFWPGTGLWRMREGRGVRSLLKIIGKGSTHD